MRVSSTRTRAPPLLWRLIPLLYAKHILRAAELLPACDLVAREVITLQHLPGNGARHLPM